MTTPQHPTHQSPIFEALDEAIDETTDDATEDMLVEVVSAVWYGFDSPEEIDALITEGAARGDPFDVEKVRAVAAQSLAKKRNTEARWPQITDCDKLNGVFDRLHELGICALQCAGHTLEEGFEAVVDMLADERVADDRYHGYCFFHSQDIDHALDDGNLLLAFGHVDQGEANEKDHVAVGQTVCNALTQMGLEVDWDGSLKHRIRVIHFNWQRRTPA